jgi:hypothetical protein
MGFKIHAKAVITGVLAGIGLGLLIGPLETLFLFGPSLTGTPLHIVSLTLGSLATLLAAYLTARLSPTDKFANVMIFWAINEALGTMSLFVPTLPIWYDIVGVFSVLIASVLGWYLERITRQASEMGLAPQKDD